MKRTAKNRLWIWAALAVLVWLAGMGIGGPYFGKINDVVSNDPATFLPKEAEATKVNAALGQFTNSTTIPLLIAFENTNKQPIMPDQQRKLAMLLPELKSVPDVTLAGPAQLSKDGQAALLILPINRDADLPEVFPVIKEKLNNANLGMQYYLGGPASFFKDLSAAFAGIDGTLLFVALGVVLLILLIVYRSPLLPILVLMNSIAALSVAIMVVYELAKNDIVQVNGQVQGILSILVIGAATDYSLLYIARYREELSEYASRWQATKVAWRASLEPVAAAGLTVCAGLLCLLASELQSNKALGPVGAIGVVLAMLASMTFLPAMLALIGRPVFWPRKPKYAPADHQSVNKLHPKWAKVGRLVGRHPRRLWVGSTALLLIACLGLFQLKASGVPQDQLILGKSEARDSQKVIDKHFPSGSGSPMYVLTPATVAQQAVKIIQEDSSVVSVLAMGDRGPVPVAMGKTVNGQKLLQATLVADAYSAKATNTVLSLRGKLHALSPQILVGGTTALQHDNNQSSRRDLKVIIPLILLAVTIILVFLLRSLWAPLVLLLTTLLSFGATLGVAAWLFNHVWHFPGADPSVVIFGFVFLVALGIDYNIFLMTRVREEIIKTNLRTGVLKALVVTGGVITSAGIVLAATFAALGVITILFLVQIAFVVAFGVLLDTLLVRSLLVPSLSLELGPKIWWPTKVKKESK